MKTKIVFSPEYEVDLGTHPFATAKFRLVKETLIKEETLKENDFILPPIRLRQTQQEEIQLVHTPEYFQKINSLDLDYSEILRLEIPLTEEIVKASKICCAGTILTCELALSDGRGIHLGGGFHHAFPDHGEGFCIFNDLAVAIRKMQKESKIVRPVIVDCDLHQGNGTARIFRDNPEVFTFSIHQEDIYPYPKEKSDLDIGLSSSTNDTTYLSLLEDNLKKIFEKHQPDFVLYQAGADPYREDQLGSLNLTISGLKTRDEIVRDIAEKYGLPVAVTLGGGYAVNTADTVSIHTNTVKVFLKKV